jgi:hypothetical protein
MRVALRLARRGYGTTSPNPMFGAGFLASPFPLLLVTKFPEYPEPLKHVEF